MGSEILKEHNKIYHRAREVAKRGYLDEAFSEMALLVSNHSFFQMRGDVKRRDIDYFRRLAQNYNAIDLSNKRTNTLQRAQRLDASSSRMLFEEKALIVSCIQSVLEEAIALERIGMADEFPESWKAWIVEFIESSDYLEKTENQIRQLNPTYIGLHELSNKCFG